MYACMPKAISEAPFGGSRSPFGSGRENTRTQGCLAIGVWHTQASPFNYNFIIIIIISIITVMFIIFSISIASAACCRLWPCTTTYCYRRKSWKFARRQGSVDGGVSIRCSRFAYGSRSWRWSSKLFPSTRCHFSSAPSSYSYIYIYIYTCICW